MVDGHDQHREAPRPNIFWWLTLGYAALAGMGWLTLAMRRLLQWLQYNQILRATAGQVDAETLRAQVGFVGAVRVDLLFAVGTAAVFGYAAAALVRRTWNAWDHATLAIGTLTVFSLIMLCASGRVMRFIPLSSAPLLALLYLPGTKTACGVQKGGEPATPTDLPVTALSRAEIEQEIAKERTLIAQLSQNLDVFEVERAMDTDRFVARYTEGLEEESADNAEWFSIARAVRRSRERLAALRAQLDVVPER